MSTKQILPIIITMVVTGLIIYILMWQRGGPCECDCKKMQQRINQLEEVIGDSGDVTISLHKKDAHSP